MRLQVSRDGLRLGALLLICFADTARLGYLDPVGLVLMFGAIALMLLSLWTARDTPPGMPLWEVAVAGLLLMMLQLPHQRRVEFDPNLYRPMIGLAVVLALGALSLRRRGRWSLALLGLLGLTQLSLMAVSLIRNWGAAPIDVFDVQQLASRALLGGGNPYGPLIDQLVGDGLSPGRVVASPFPYGPSIALLDLPARALGDVRLTHLVAFLALLGVLVLLARRGAPGRELLIAVLWLAFPLNAGMVEYAWIDIIIMAGLGFWLVLRARRPWWAIAALAVVLAGKPIFLPALIPAFVWSRSARRELVLAAAGALLILIPFALATGVSRFVADVVTYHLVQTHYDSLNVGGYLRLIGQPPLPLALVVVVTLAVGGLSIVRRPRDQGDMLTAGAIICIIGFLMSKQAYFNYYYIPAVLLVMALAARRLPVDGEAGPEPRGRAPSSAQGAGAGTGRPAATVANP